MDIIVNEEDTETMTNCAPHVKRKYLFVYGLNCRQNNMHVKGHLAH